MPVVLVGAEALAAWTRSWEGGSVFATGEQSGEACARRYLASATLRTVLRRALSERIARIRRKDEREDEMTPFERGVWLSISRDALLAAGDVDAQNLLGSVFADEPPAKPLRALSAATHVLSAEAPPLLIVPGTGELDAAIRAEIEVAEAAPLLPIAVATAPKTWHDWLRSSTREHAKAMVRPFAIELASSEPHVEPSEESSRSVVAKRERTSSRAPVAETFRALVERAKRTQTREDDDAARSAAERLLFEALEGHERSRGRFELNRCLDRKFGNRPLEIDLACVSPKLAIEVDGFFHFGAPDRYRRDRRKDLVLQKEGYLVMRFLAEDVMDRLAEVVSTIHDELPKGIER